jgi:hypothetical protein
MLPLKIAPAECLAPASEVAGGHTLPFQKGYGLPILKWYGISSILRPLRPELDGSPSFSWSNLRMHHQNQHNCTPLVVYCIVQCNVYIDIAIRVDELGKMLSKIFEKQHFFQ